MAKWLLNDGNRKKSISDSLAVWIWIQVLHIILTLLKSYGHVPLYLKQNLPMWLFTTSKGTKIGLSKQEKWGVKMHRNRESLCRFYDLHCISCSIWFMTPYSPVMVFMPSNAILGVGIWMGNPKYTYLQLPWIKSPLAFLLAPMCERVLRFWSLVSMPNLFLS